MSAEKCGGGSLTIEMLRSAYVAGLRESSRPTMFDRNVSFRTADMLKKIQAKIPGWDNWTVPAEIWLKARSLGITEEE